MRRTITFSVFSILIAGGLLFGLGRSRMSAQTSSTAINYPVGWNMVAFPPGTDLSGVVGPLYTLQQGDSNYETINTSQGTVSGFGYWAYFANPTTVRLAPSSASAYQVTVPANQWVMVGDPSDTAAVRVTGASYVFLYNSDGGAYVADATLQPGQGAWIYSVTGGVVQLRSTPAPQSCGSVSVTSLSITPGPTATATSSAQQAETCFAQASQTCNPVSLTYTFAGPPDTGHTQHLFMLDNSGRSLGAPRVITDTLTAFPGFVAPSQAFPKTSYYFCNSVSQSASGLVFSGCGSERTVTVPSS